MNGLTPEERRRIFLAKQQPVELRLPASIVEALLPGLE